MTVAENLLIMKFRGEKRASSRKAIKPEGFQTTIEKVGNGLERSI